MEYKTLEKIYYSSPNDYEKIYLDRYNGDYTHRLHFDIGGNKAFFIVTPDIQKKMLSIQRMDKTVSRLCAQLPGKAIEQFTRRCLIDELVLTNSIEGVSSTRREMYEVLEGMGRGEAKKRFTGLTQKYIMLQRGEGIRLETCEDIRKIYDELVLPEVTDEDPKNAPDGVLFRKDSVSVCSGAQKEIHRGLYPERKIISAMESALEYLNDESEELLLRTAVFHYLLGYIHPFYDGNGRLNRFISSCMMAKELEPVSGYRLSYTIKENLGDYNNAFKVCNRPQNKGDLTPFVEMFISVIEKSMSALRDALEKRSALLTHYSLNIGSLPDADSEIIYELYSVLIQARLFSENGVSMGELCAHLNRSGETVRKKLAVVKNSGLLITKTVKREKFYGIDLELIDNFIAYNARQALE